MRPSPIYRHPRRGRAQIELAEVCGSPESDSLVEKPSPMSFASD